MSVDPDVFIIDEALAAGDAYFVHKCMGKIREICASGKTVFFVSHSEGLIAELCDRALWLDGGRLVLTGEAEPVAKAYIQSVWEREKTIASAEDQGRLERLRKTADTGRYELGGEGVRLVSVRTLGADYSEQTAFTNGDTLRIAIDWEGSTTDVKIYSSFRIDGDRLQAVSGFEAYEFGAFINGGRPLEGRKGRILYTIPRLELGEGRYQISVSLCRHMLPKGKEAILHYLEKAVAFSVKRNTPWHIAYVYEPKIEVEFQDR